MKLTRGLLAVAGLLAGLAGCSSDSSGPTDSAVQCNTYAFGATSIILTVYDQRTRALLSDAAAEFKLAPRVINFGPPLPEVVLPGDTYFAPPDGSSTIHGPKDWPGTFAITVTRPGYATWSRDGVRVLNQDCTLQTVRMDVELVPTHNDSKPPEIPCPPPHGRGAITFLVRDSVTGQAVFGVTATAVKPDGYSQTVTAPSDNFFELAPDTEERMEGTYAVTLRRAGYQDWNHSEIVTRGRCGIEPVLLDLRMVPL